eukprot:12996094-Heterocapsa_arctica.AAC.1
MGSRENTHSSTILSMLFARRVRWIQTIARIPSHHLLLLATVTCKPKDAQYNTLDEHGVPTRHATPCFRQWWDDLQIVACKCIDFAQHLRTSGWRAIC